MRFTKMEGAGNDYLYINGFEEQVDDPAALSVRIHWRQSSAVGSNCAGFSPPRPHSRPVKVFILKWRNA